MSKSRIKIVIVISAISLMGLMVFGFSMVDKIYNIERAVKNQTIEISVETGMVFTVEATGYAIGPPYNSITRSGQPVISTEFIMIGGVEIFTIAVDPNVIPLGSIVFIFGWGIALATDTGPEIRGMEIDICFQNMSDAMKFGRQKVKVIILRNGNQKEEAEK